MKAASHLLVLRNGWETASCGNAMADGNRLTTDASKVTCRACLVLLPTERAGALRALLEAEVATGPVAVVAVTVRVTRIERVTVRVPPGSGVQARAERLALLTVREQGATDVHVTTEVIDKRHSHR